MAKRRGNPTSAQRNDKQLLLGVFFVFGIGGYLLAMVQSDPWGWMAATVTAAFSGVIAAGWAHAISNRRFWLLVPLNVVPFFAGDWFFTPLGSLGIYSIGYDHTPLVRRMTSAILGTVWISIGFSLVINYVAREERRAGRYKTEIDLGQKIHARLVTPVALREDGVEIAGRSDASAEMGGDLLDLVRAGDRIDLLVGDVSGHGVAAGVVMAMVKGAVRSRLMRDDPGAPSDLLEDLTRIVDGTGAPGMFVTMSSVRFRRGSRRVEVALAGHNPVLWWRGAEDRLHAIDNEGLPLGVSADERYATTAIEPSAGDWIVLYTDGLVEVNDTEDRQLGMRGFRAIVADVVRGAGSADMVVARVLERVRAHGPITDDQTIAVVRFAP